MSNLPKYSIQYKSLELGKEYIFNFIVDNSFFENREKSRILGGDIKVEVIFIRRPDSLFIDIILEGFLLVTCSRCLENYDHYISFEDNIEVLLSDETNYDTNENFVLLDSKLNEIDLSQFIYEFCDFALPLSCTHATDNNGKSECDSEMLKKIEQYNKENYTDPRWDSLRELKN
jgi:uncharacterized protein